MKKESFIILPLSIGVAISLLTKPYMLNYNGLLPKIIFPIVWSILYLLIGLSMYLIKDDDELLTLFKVNLIFNYAWTFIFFVFNMKILAFIWVIMLIIITTYMIKKLRKVNKLSSNLLIPYDIWLVFASILNIIEIFR